MDEKIEIIFNDAREKIAKGELQEAADLLLSVGSVNISTDAKIYPLLAETFEKMGKKELAWHCKECARNCQKYLDEEKRLSEE